MKVYAMFVRIVPNEQFRIINAGWRYEGMTSDEQSIQRFKDRAKFDIEETKHNTVFNRTLEYKIVELDI